MLLSGLSQGYSSKNIQWRVGIRLWHKLGGRGLRRTRIPISREMVTRAWWIHTGNYEAVRENKECLYTATDLHQDAVKILGSRQRKVRRKQVLQLLVKRNALVSPSPSRKIKGVLGVSSGRRSNTKSGSFLPLDIYWFDFETMIAFNIIFKPN